MAKLLDSLGERLDTTHRSIVGSLMQILAGGFSHMPLPHPIVPSLSIYRYSISKNRRILFCAL